ncbi:MAG: hypothetical protein AVDCRST_MAG44-1693, partial [uncultured Sphingomonas sp.]
APPATGRRAHRSRPAQAGLRRATPPPAPAPRLRTSTSSSADRRIQGAKVWSAIMVKACAAATRPAL